MPTQRSREFYARVAYGGTPNLQLNLYLLFIYRIGKNHVYSWVSGRTHACLIPDSAVLIRTPCYGWTTKKSYFQ